VRRRGDSLKKAIKSVIAQDVLTREVEATLAADRALMRDAGAALAELRETMRRLTSNSRASAEPPLPPVL